MNEHGRNETDIFRCLDVEYTPEGHSEVYRWDDFLKIAGGHVHSAMYLIDMVSAGGEYEGEEPEYAYACEIVGCCGLRDGVALFRPVSHDGANLIQIAFLRNDVDDATGAYTERFEAGSFGVPSDVLPCSEFGVDLLEYFNGRSFKYTPGVNRGLDAREAVNSIEDAIGCDLGLFDGFWLGVPGEADMRVGPYSKKNLLDFSYYAKELSCRYGFADSDILEIARHLPQECPDRLAAVKAYLDCEYVPDGNELDEKTYRWGDFLEIAGGDARYAAMLIDRTSPGEPEEGLHPETLVDQDIRDGEAFMLAGRPIVPKDIYDLPETVRELYKELLNNVDRSGMLLRDWRGFPAGTDADDVLRAIDGAFGETEYSRAGTVFGAYAANTFHVAEDAAHDVTPLTPWEDEDGVAFLSRTLDADAGATVPCLWYCMSGGEEGFDVGEVLSSDELMDEVHDALERHIDIDLDDEIGNFDSMLRELKRGDDPEHPAEISVVAKGTVERWDKPSRGLVIADSLLSLVSGTGSADALKDCQIDRIVDMNGEFHIEASHHDGSAYLDVRLISGVSLDANGFKLGGEYYAPGKMSIGDFHILLDNLYDSPDVGPCSLPRLAERAYGTARESYRFGETRFDIYQVAASPDRPYTVKISTGGGACGDAGLQFASVGEAKEWCYRYSLREVAEGEKRPEPAAAAATAKRAAWRTGGDGAGDAGAIKL